MDLQYRGLIAVVRAGIAFILIAFILIAPWPEVCRFPKPHEEELVLEWLAVDRGHVDHVPDSQVVCDNPRPIGKSGPGIPSTLFNQPCVSTGKPIPKYAKI